MLRVASREVVFLEPHDSFVGRRLGHVGSHGGATNLVFRWNTRTVEQVSASYLGTDNFENLSFSFWHHNPAMVRAGSRVSPNRAVRSLKLAKAAADFAVGRLGNQFCGIVIKHQ